MWLCQDAKTATLYRQDNYNKAVLQSLFQSHMARLCRWYPLGLLLAIICCGPPIVNHILVHISSLDKECTQKSAIFVKVATFDRDKAIANEALQGIARSFGGIDLLFAVFGRSGGSELRGVNTMQPNLSRTLISSCQYGVSITN